jgi:proton-coupled amino acid transporter
VYENVILIIICFYAFFGITCWMAFGNEVRTVLTTSLPETGLSTTVQLAYSLAVVLTFPLQNFPALEIACKSIGNLIPSAGCCKQPMIKRNIISSFLVMALALVAVTTMDSLDKVVSLMGSLLGCPIAFVFPPLIHSQLCADTLTPARKWGNRIVVFLGLVAMILASITTLAAW